MGRSNVSVPGRKRVPGAFGGKAPKNSFLFFFLVGKIFFFFIIILASLSCLRTKKKNHAPLSQSLFLSTV